MKNWTEIQIGDYIDIITDYHANGSYETLKNNITLKYEPDYAIMIRTLNFESNDLDNNGAPSPRIPDLMNNRLEYFSDINYF